MQKFTKFFNPLLLLTSIAVSSLITLEIETQAYVLNGTRQPNVAAITWKEQLVFAQLYNPFITAKNDWDATRTKAGFAMLSMGIPNLSSMNLENDAAQSTL